MHGLIGCLVQWEVSSKEHYKGAAAENKGESLPADHLAIPDGKSSAFSAYITSSMEYANESRLVNG